MKKLWFPATLALFALATLAPSGRASETKEQGCTGKEADVEAALSCRLSQSDANDYQAALEKATNDAGSKDEIPAAREKVTEQYLAKLPKDQQEQFSSFVGKSKFKVPEGVTKQLQDAGICPDGAYDKGQCVSKTAVANKPATNAKDATSKAPEKDQETAKGLATKEPPTAGAYPAGGGDGKKPFKLSDTQKAGVVSGFWGALLFGMLMGPAGLIMGGAIAAAAGYAMAKQGSDDSGGGKSKSGGGGGGGHEGGGHHDSPGSHVHVDTSKIHF